MACGLSSSHPTVAAAALLLLVLRPAAVVGADHQPCTAGGSCAAATLHDYSTGLRPSPELRLEFRLPGIEFTEWQNQPALGAAFQHVLQSLIRSVWVMPPSTLSS